MKNWKYVKARIFPQPIIYTSRYLLNVCQSIKVLISNADLFLAYLGQILAFAKKLHQISI